jgi:S-layer protein
MSVEIITGYYQTILRRTPSTAEVASWNTVVQGGGLTLEQVRTFFLNSPENSNLVDPIIRLYQSAFNRQPDSAGLDHWVNVARSGTSITQIATLFGQQTEFTNRYGTDTAVSAAYVISLYNNILGRTPSNAEITSWTSSGLSRGAILRGFSDAPEAVTRYETAINTLLDGVAQGTSTLTPTQPLGGTTGVTAGQTFPLTTGADTITGTAGNDTINGAQIGADASFTVGDTINGGAGTDTFNITQNAAFGGLPTGASVTNVETVNVVSGAAVTLDTSTGFSGLTALNATSKSSAGSTSLTAAATTNVTVTESDLRPSATSQVIVNGGNNVTVTATGTTNNGTALTAATGANAEILIGATTAVTGAVTVTNSFKGADATKSGDIFVKGGSAVTVTQTVTNTTTNETNTQGDVSVVGTAVTKTVTVNQDATVAASPTGTGRVGKTTGAVTITDVNSTSTTAAGAIETVTLKNANTATVNSGALKTLNLQGTLVTVDAGTLGQLTTPANTALALNLTGATSTGAVTIDTDIKTLNVSGNTTASTINSLVASGATNINVSGDARVTFTGNTTGAVTDIVVTNTGGAVFGTALGTAVNFTGGAGADSIILTASHTKAITMGAGNDTVTYAGAAGTGGSVAAGDGTDSIKMAAAQADAADADSTFNSKFTGFETLRVSDAFNVTVDLDGVNAASRVVLEAGANAGTINNLSSGGTVEILANNGGTLAVGVKSALVGSSDVLNLVLTKSGSALVANSITAANVETINISAADAASAGSTANINTMTLVATSATSVVVTGNNGLNLTNTGNTKITNFDASGVVANNTVDGPGVAATTDTAANLAVTFASANNTASASVTIKGGEGTDTLTGNISKDTITGGAGADRIYADNQGTKEVQNIAASTTDGAAVLTVTILGFATTVTLTAATTAPAMQTAIVNAVNGNTSLAGLVTASAGGTDSVDLTYAVDGNAAAVTVVKASGAGNLTLGTISETTAGTVGTAAVDSLDGGAGADLLVGGGGADTITTGGGADRVFMLKAHSNQASLATITDFTFAAGGTSNDTLILGDVVAAAGTVTTVQDLSAQSTLAAAFDAASLGNTVDNGLVLFIHGGNTYAYVEATGLTATYQAGDFAVRLTGVPFTAGTAIAGLGFDAV